MRKKDQEDFEKDLGKIKKGNSSKKSKEKKRALHYINLLTKARKEVD